MRIVYASDLHVEINRKAPPLSQKLWAPGEVLVLAGDLIPAIFLQKNRTDSVSRSLQRSIQDLKDNVFPEYEKVLYVMGNHDHYHGVYSESYQLLKDWFSDVPNFHILENEALEYKGVRFLGCTLWTDFNAANPLDMLAVEGGLNDYLIIYLGEKIPIRANFILQRHKESMDFLSNELSKAEGKPTVVITHHAPCLVSLSRRHSGRALDAGYASRLDDFIQTYPEILAWIHGHTHESKEYPVGKTLVVSNQRGYQNEKCFNIFTPNRYLEIDLERGIAVPAEFRHVESPSA